MPEPYSQELELTSISGVRISDDRNFEDYEFDNSFPLRHRLREVSRFCWVALLNNNHSKKTVIATCELLEDAWQEFMETTAEMTEADVPNPKYKKTGVPPLRSWIDNAELHSTIDCLPDDWPSKLPTSEYGGTWTWVDIEYAAALLAVGYAARYLDDNEPYLAASWCAEAYSHHGLSMGMSWSNSAVTSLAKRGAAQRHRGNREAKLRAIQIYESRSWRSQMQAAREIAKQVCRTEIVVVRWIRAHKKSTLPAE